MWCPSCQSRSPMVAIQPEGLICARCQVEVEFGDRVIGEVTGKAKLAGPHHTQATPEAKAVRAAADAPPAFAASAQVAQATSLRLATGHSPAARAAGEVAGLPIAPRTADRGLADRGSIEPKPIEEAASIPFARPTAKPNFVSSQPLYRFDGAHPPVGGRTQAALELQKGRMTAPPQAAAPVASAAPAAPAGNPKPPAATETRAAATAAAESPLRSAPLADRPDPLASSKAPEQDFALLRELAGFADSKSKPAEPAAAPLSEFALRPVPRSFLFPRRTNLWPGRLCLLSGGLFISGQCWLLYSFLRSEALGVATGILASAGAFALALYMIARYCDEELER